VEQLAIGEISFVMSTRAIQYLRQKNVYFEVIKYEHREKCAEFAADAIGFPLENTIKTLVVALDTNDYRLALMPGNLQLALKRFARVCSAKRAVMADTSTAQRLTGYQVGSISPFGIKKYLPAIMDSSLSVYGKVAINAGQRGTMLVMRPSDIIDTLHCMITDIAEMP
jgi:Cys-tRNA(Pro)/Cys-tRNA(Cys) deacylase